MSDVRNANLRLSRYMLDGVSPAQIIEQLGYEPEDVLGLDTTAAMSEALMGSSDRKATSRAFILGVLAERFKGEDAPVVDLAEIAAGLHKAMSRSKGRKAADSFLKQLGETLPVDGLAEAAEEIVNKDQTEDSVIPSPEPALEDLLSEFEPEE